MINTGDLMQIENQDLLVEDIPNHWECGTEYQKILTPLCFGQELERLIFSKVLIIIGSMI